MRAFRLPIILGFVSGLLSYAPFSVWPVYLISFALVYQKLTNIDDRKQALGFSFAFWYMHIGTSLYWVVNALSVDWAKYWPIAPLCLLGLPLLFVGWYVLATYIWHRFCRDYKGRTLAFSLLWLAAEMSKAYAFTGFPWNLPADIWTDCPLILHVCSYIGAYGLSALTILCACSLGVFFRHKSYVIPGLLMILWFVLPKLSVFPAIPDTALRVHLVQPNIPQVARMDGAYASAALKTLLDLSIPPHADGHLIIWPEGVLPFPVKVGKQPEGLEAYLRRITQRKHTLMASAVRYEGEKPNHTLYNSCLWVNPKGTITKVIDKAHLLPFGEFMPLRRVLPKLLADLAVGPVDMSSGNAHDVFTLKSGWTLKPLICFESLFANLVDPNTHPDALIVVTNDAWYGVSPGQYQHLSSAKLRAAEFGIPVLHVANTGVTAVIDGRGRILHHILLNQTGTISTFLPQKCAQTFYHTNRWWGLILVILMQIGVWGYRRKRLS